MKLRMPEMPSATLLTALDGYNLLPAIVFLPTRRRCDQAASEAALARRDPNDQRREARREFMRAFVQQHGEVRGHRHWDTIIRGGVASHHAGHIPAWKLVIEKLMRRVARRNLCYCHRRCRRRLSRAHGGADWRRRTDRKWLASIVCF